MATRCTVKVGEQSRYHGDDPTVCGERAHHVVAGVDMCRRHKRKAERHAIGHDNALQRIEQCVREVEILCSQFGYDRNEWLAELPDESTGRGFPMTTDVGVPDLENELRIALDKLRAARQENITISSKLDGSLGSLEIAGKRIAELEALIKHCDARLTYSGEAIELLQSRLDASAKAIEAWERSGAKSEGYIAELRQEVADLEATSEKDENLIASLQSRLASSEKEVTRLLALDQYRTDETNRALATLSSRLEPLEIIENKYRNLCDVLNEQTAEIKALSLRFEQCDLARGLARGENMDLRSELCAAEGARDSALLRLDLAIALADNAHQYDSPVVFAEEFRKAIGVVETGIPK